MSLVMAAVLAYVINRASIVEWDWLEEDPARVWLVGVIVLLTTVVLALILARDNVSRPGPAYGTGGHSFRTPALGGPVRGRIRLRLRLSLLTVHGLVVLVGAGGMGKTTLATSAARAIPRRLLQRVHWIRARDEEELSRHMLEVAQRLGLRPDRIAAAQEAGESLPDLVWHHLDRTPGWIIVLDNIDRSDATSPAGDPVAEYRGWIRRPRWGLLLVTSRDREGWGRKAEVHPVGPLRPQAAAKVLRDLAPSGGGDEGALRLARRLGGLPLALQVAARSINAPLTRYPSFDAYADALEARTASLLPERPDVEDPEVLRRLIGYTWELSLDQLTAESLVLARPVMRLLALCADRPIPRQLITASLLHDVVGRDATDAAVDGAVVGLYRYGLIEADTFDGVQVVKIHPVVRESMAALLAHEADANRWRCAVDAALVDFTRECVSPEHGGSSLPHVLAPHLLMLTPLQDPRLANDPAGVASACDALHSLGMHLVSAEDRRPPAVPPRQPVFPWPKVRRPAIDHRETLALCHDLAVALDSLGAHEKSVELHRANLEVRDKRLGSDDPDTMASRQHVASSAAVASAGGTPS